MSARTLRDSGPALVLGLAAVLLASGAPRAEECTAQVAGALYPAEITHEDSAGFGTFRDWLCTHPLTTHGQALAEGLPEGALVYGVPLRPGRSFRAEEIARWRELHCTEATSQDVARAELALRSLAEPRALAGLEECQGDSGLRCSAVVEGEFAIFRASYHEFRRTARVDALRVDGEPATDLPFPDGHPLGSDGLVYARKLEDARSLAFELDTAEGTCSATAVVRYERRVNRRRAP
jgi:hypothetical protein